MEPGKLGICVGGGGSPAEGSVQAEGGGLPSMWGKVGGNSLTMSKVRSDPYSREAQQGKGRAE